MPDFLITPATEPNVFFIHARSERTDALHIIPFLRYRGDFSRNVGEVYEVHTPDMGSYMATSLRTALVYLEREIDRLHAKEAVA